MSEQAKYIGGGAALGALAGAAGGKGLTEAARWGMLKRLKSSPDFARKVSEKAFRKNPDKFGVDEITKKPSSILGRFGPSEERLIQRPLSQDEIINLTRKSKMSGKTLALAALLGGGAGAYAGYNKLMNKYSGVMNKYSGINTNMLKHMQQELVALTKLANEMAADNVAALQSGEPMPHTSETSSHTPQDAKPGPALPTDPVKKEKPFSLLGHNPKGRVGAFKGMFGRKARKPGLQKVANKPLNLQPSKPTPGVVPGAAASKPLAAVSPGGHRLANRRKQLLAAGWKEGGNVFNQQMALARGESPGSLMGRPAPLGGPKPGVIGRPAPLGQPVRLEQAGGPPGKTQTLSSKVESFQKKLPVPATSGVLANQKRTNPNPPKPAQAQQPKPAKLPPLANPNQPKASPTATPGKPKLTP